MKTNQGRLVHAMQSNGPLPQVEDMDNSIQKPPFLLETRDFQISLSGNPVSNRRTPKTPLNRNCSDTKKKNCYARVCCDIYRWIYNINSVTAVYSTKGIGQRISISGYIS